MQHRSSLSDDVFQTKSLREKFLWINELFLIQVIKTTVAAMSVNYAAGLSPYADKGVCGLPEVNNESF